MKRWAPRPEARVRIFCFPWAGGTAAAFRRWAFTFPTEIEVCAIEYPGRGTREAEPAIPTVGELAASVAGAVRSLLDRPFLAFGYSLGALVAFEWLRTAAPGARHLVLCARRAPHLRGSLAPLVDLPHEAFIAEVQRRFSAIPEPLLAEPELLRRFAAPLRADLRAVLDYSYVPGPPLACPITAVGGRDDRDATAAELEAWAVHTSAGFRAVQLDAGHFFVDSARLREIVLREVELAAA